MTDARRIVLAARPEGRPTLDNFREETAPLPAPAEGEMIVRTIWLSLDPYMRGRMDAAKSYAPPVEVGGVMEGAGVGEVVEAAPGGYAPGTIVVGRLGWSSHAVVKADEVRVVDPDAAPIQTALGVLGMPGHTAWVGLNDIAGATDGETIVVSAATGAVGAMVGQLAKRAGLTVVGVAGGAEKCRWAEEELGFDACLDHRAHDAESLREALSEAAPRGVDIYYENVGGKTLQAVLPLMNQAGRIPVCGMIAWYSGQGVSEAMALPAVWRAILVKRLRVQGFIVFDHAHRFDVFQAEVAPLVKAGEIRWRETVAEGLEAAPQAFLDLLAGKNFGKQLVRVGPDP